MSDSHNNQVIQQITDLQLLLMEQERVIESYSQLLRDQQDQISRLNSRLLGLEHKITKYEEVGDSTEQHEVPPHY